jgi:manganese/zinc/iron transport system permease protein
MSFSLWDFFTHPVLRASTLGCMLMCLSASLVGVAIFLRKRSLLGESLSHAAYPGAVIGIGVFAYFFPRGEKWAALAVLAGAFLSSLAGLKAIEWLEQKGKVKADAALCFVLAVFFGVGIVLASAMQSIFPVWLSQIQMLLFGQAATMTDVHIAIYGALAALVTVFLFLTFRPLQASLFDRNFALGIKLPVRFLEKALFFLLLVSLIVGIRSVGVVLMSAMVIAPVVAARQFSDRLQTIFWGSGAVGVFSGFLGNYLSVMSPVSLPTGPMIVLSASTIALFSLLFAPKRGLAFRLFRIAAFRIRCLEENILKAIWKKEGVSLTSLHKDHQVAPSLLRYALFRLKKEGWVIASNGQLFLSDDGRKKGASIIRLHRLFELYLADMLGVEGENIHRTAEEMEHILTPEIEERLTKLLSNPTQDPHSQPIPGRNI